MNPHLGLRASSFHCAMNLATLVVPLPRAQGHHPTVGLGPSSVGIRRQPLAHGFALLPGPAARASKLRGCDCWPESSSSRTCWVLLSFARVLGRLDATSELRTERRRRHHSLRRHSFVCRSRASRDGQGQGPEARPPRGKRVSKVCKIHEFQEHPRTRGPNRTERETLRDSQKRRCSNSTTLCSSLPQPGGLRSQSNAPAKFEVQGARGRRGLLLRVSCQGDIQAVRFT